MAQMSHFHWNIEDKLIFSQTEIYAPIHAYLSLMWLKHRMYETVWAAFAVCIHLWHQGWRQGASLCSQTVMTASGASNSNVAFCRLALQHWKLRAQIQAATIPKLQETQGFWFSWNANAFHTPDTWGEMLKWRARTKTIHTWHTWLGI